MRVKNKVCIVTGGGRGLGRAIVEKLASNGALMVFACDLNPESFKELESRFDNVKGQILDVTITETIEPFIMKVVKEYGKIDVLVNNAGITKDALVHKMSDEDWNLVVNINLKGVFNMGRAIGPVMMEQGNGSIINMASIVGIDGNIGQTNYAATKGGVISMTKTWAKEFSRKGAQVRCNAVAPGFIKTPMTEKVPENILEGIISKTPLKRMGEPEDIANLVLFLASDESSFITCQAIRIDGGLVF